MGNSLVDSLNKVLVNAVPDESQRNSLLDLARIAENGFGNPKSEISLIAKKACHQYPFSGFKSAWPGSRTTVLDIARQIVTRSNIT